MTNLSQNSLCCPATCPSILTPRSALHLATERNNQRVEMPIQTEQGQPTRCSNLKHTGPRHACVPPLLKQGDPRSPRLPPALSTAPDFNPSTAATSMAQVAPVTPAFFPQPKPKISAAPQNPPPKNKTAQQKKASLPISSLSAGSGISPRRF